MGIVYRARDMVTSETVAIKLLTGGIRGVDRFLREIEIIARLHHPRIVRYVARGLAPDGAPFLAMEWLDGETLEHRLQRGPLGLRDAIELGRSIAEALDAAHAIGVVHRDLKPANVLLVRGSIEDVKVVDFGVARLASGGPVLTASGEIVGTPAYMSPEQALSKPVDGRSDIFSLGSILYRAISGVYPFEAESALRMLLRLTQSRAAPLSSVAPRTPATLALAVDGMLTPDPCGRPESAAAVHAALTVARSELAKTAAILPSADIPTKPAAGSLATKTESETKLRTVYFAIFAVGTVAMLLLGAAGIWAFVFSPSQTTSVPSSKKNTTSQPEPSPNVLGSATLTAEDPSHVDPLALVPAALALGRIYGGGELTLIEAPRIRIDGVDLASGDTIKYQLTNDVQIVVNRTELVASRGADRHADLPIPESDCGVRAAFQQALSQKRAAGPWEMTLLYPRARPHAVYSFTSPVANGVVQIPIDSVTCKTLFGTHSNVE